MQVNLLILMCSILLLLLSQQCTTNLVNREIEPNAENTSTNDSNSFNTNYTISNFQTKTVNPANLSDVQLQEAKEAAEKEKSKLGAGKESTNSSGEKSPRRKITPTDNKPIEPAGNNNAITNNTSVKSQNRDVETGMVAENVALNGLKGTEEQASQNQTLKTSPITNDSTKDNANNITKVFPVKPTTTGIKVFPNNKISSNSNKTSNATASTTTTKTSTTTTTTTTAKPKKPTVTYGLEDYKHLDGETPLNISSSSKPPSSTKLPTAPETAPIREAPNAEPSQEINSSSSFPYNSSRDYIVPILTILFTVPLAIGVVITAYRRFKDCWSTRHYRRMDFLVDGMYND